MDAISTNPEIDALLAADSPVAIGVSGGKDSSAVALLTVRHLDSIGHNGPRLLIHSDLGMTEWKTSLSMCEGLAERLGIPLVVVRRAKGGMMERWEQRWADNCARYIALECVKLILPWSTPGMRFCTSEMKVAPICQDLCSRFAKSLPKKIVNVTGIRRAESDGRQNAPVCKAEPKLTSKYKVKQQFEKNGKAVEKTVWLPSTAGVTWNPNLEMSTERVYSYLAENKIPLHEAYTKWDMSRVSCALCILQNQADQINSLKNPEHHPLFRRMVDLEAVSTFAFQGSSWLADRGPHLLENAVLAAIASAKKRAALRQESESVIPDHLLYTKGWPTCIPTAGESEMLAMVRRDVAAVIGLDVQYTDAESVRERYRELYVAKHGAI